MVEDGENEPPSLLINYGQRLQTYLIYSASKNQFRILNNFPEFLNMSVAGSSYGWLFLADTDNNCRLFNPISRDIIELPSNLENPIMFTCILTKPPYEPDCHVFLSNNCCMRAFCRIGDGEFVIHKEPGHCMISIVSFQGQIYGLIVEPDPELVTIDFVDKTLQFRPILRVDEVDSPLSNRIWLMESSNELLMVQKIYLSSNLNIGLDFRIFRVDTNLKRCTEVEGIGDRTIFLSHNGRGYCCRAMGVKPNSIYYTSSSDFRDRNLNIFYLEDKSRISMLPSRIVRDKYFRGSWVQGITL